MGGGCEERSGGGFVSLRVLRAEDEARRGAYV